VKSLARRGLLILAPLLLMVGVISGVANREVMDGQRFASHADAVRSDEQVSQLIGVAISRQILKYDQDLVALRPAIDAVMVSLVRSPAFTPIVEAAVVQIHEAFTTPGSDQVVLRLADLTAVVIAALRTVAPGAVSALPADLDVQLASIGGQSFAAHIFHATRVVGLLSWVLPLLALLCLGVALWLARRRQRTLAECGLAIAAAGVLEAALCAIGGAFVSTADTHALGGAIVSASWDQFSPSLWRSSLILTVTGLIVFAAAGAYLPQWSAAEILRNSVRWVRDPGAGQRAQLISGIVLIVVALSALYRPSATARLVIVVLALALLAEGVSRLSRVSAAQRTADGPSVEKRPHTRSSIIGRSVIVVGVASLVAYLIVAALPVKRTLVAKAVAAPTSSIGCNGFVELCSRRYDQVSYVATPNSKSAADQQAALDEANSEYGASVVQSALRVRSALDLTPKGPIEPYLCHALCELGATPMLAAMKGVQGWIADHPREIVTFIIEDNVTPEDTAKVFQEAGLTPFVHTQAAGQPWPTLGAMIDSGQRLQVFMQRQSGAPANPWMIKAFEWMQDTPYDNASQGALNCSRLRGTAENSLLLLNNILNRFSTRVSDSAQINDEPALFAYASRCETERGQIPNFVAVDYYSKGDVFAVVDHLNGVS
jgi:hypothetical protein